MEALTLALPPTPGRSLVKRPGNENLFTLGSVFRSRGYDTAFIYGGYGYFDNMNYFFGHNGYRVIDRSAVETSEITFANAWGACDEDVFRWTIREADAAHAAGKPFHFFVMTTSNHRPFTYPEGKIDLPLKISGRAGAVKYTDYAIGQLLANAEKHPWFKNTIFVIVADHCASVAGRAELPVQNYHIPLFIYAPGGQVSPGRIKDLMSQVDYAPTLLGLLNWSYGSRFFGWDVLNTGGDRRALIGNYQKLGLYEPGELQVLKPVNGRSYYRYDEATHSLTAQKANELLSQETIGYYQTASYLYKNNGYSALSPLEQARFVQEQSPLVPGNQPAIAAGMRRPCKLPRCSIMSRMDRTFWPALALIGVVVALAELTPVDLALQDRFFDFGSQRWAVDGTAAGPRFWFYDGPKMLIITLGVTVIVLAAGPQRWRRRFDRRALMVMVATLASVPALIGVGKATTNIFCPSEIRRYGGEVPYVRLCEPYPANDRPARKGRCFPAGHASGGFALVSLAGLARTRRGRWAGAAVGWSQELTMGFYQMAKGAHYLSHTLVTALVAWWLFLLWRRVFRLNAVGRCQLSDAPHALV